MLHDIVVDTNVLMHCTDSRESRQHASVELLRRLLASTTVLCVDVGFDLDSARNQSHIGHEYLKHLRFGSLGMIVVSQLAQRKRIRFLPKRPSDVAARRKINRLITNRIDRIFLGVATNSESSILASHDHQDFPTGKRTAIRAELGVEVIEADECCSKF